MPVINYEGQAFICETGEILLDALLRHNARIPWSCHAGLCHSCIVQVSEGKIDQNAQNGLTPEQISQGMILACQCNVSDDLRLQRHTRGNMPVEVVVTQHTLLTPTLLELTLAPKQPCQVVPGQYLELAMHKDSDSRRFSVVSCPWREADIRLHIARRAGGDFSSWLFDNASPGTQLWIQGVGGDCVSPSESSQPLVILGAGAGVGAALSVAEQAIYNELRHVHVLLMDVHCQPEHQLPESLITQIESRQVLAGYISNSCLLKTGTPPKQCQWLLIGKHKRVSFLHQLLTEAGVNPDNIRLSAYIHRE